jgi:hypothetical protein
MSKRSLQQELAEIDDTIQFLEDRRNNLIARMEQPRARHHAGANLIPFPNRSSITASAVLTDHWPSDPQSVR